MSWRFLDCEDYLGCEMSSSDAFQFWKTRSKTLFDEQTGVKDKSLCLHAKMDFLTEFCMSLVLFLVPGCLLWIPVLILCCLIFAPFYLFCTVFALFSALMLIPIEQWNGIFQHRLCDLVLQYFSFKLVWEEPLDLSQKYLFVGAPHGVFPFGHLLNLIFFYKYMNFSITGVAASVVLKVPLLRQIILWMGCKDASRGTIEKALLDGKTVGLSSGGIAELFESRSGPLETVVLKERKGFVRLALKNGTPIVPCYVFGQTDVMECWNPPFLQFISRKIKASLTWFWGKYYLPIPKRTPIVAVLGAPIQVPLCKNPTQQQIDHYHSLFVQKIEEIFETHKEAYGWSHKQLIFK